MKKGSGLQFPKAANRIILVFSICLLTSNVVFAQSYQQWYADAQERIDTLRKGDFGIRILDRDGNPFTGQVSVRMVKHEFPFGISFDFYDKGSGDTTQPDNSVATREQWMQAAMYKYFNYGVTGNSFKWSGIQPLHTAPDYTNFEHAVEWTQKVGWDLRAHTLLWGGDDDHSMPAWVRNLPTPEAITDTCRMRVIREVSRYRGIIKEYDVINEPLSGHADHLRNTVGDSILWNCFKWARSADPDAELFINDYNVEYNWGQAEEYRDLILRIREMGGPVTGVGIQAHFWDCCRPNIDELVKNLNIVAEAGLPIRFTEYDYGGNLTQQQQAADFIKVLTIAFSHPSVSAMISWGLSDDGAWRENTGFFDSSHRPKLAADTLLYYTKTKWATNFDAEISGGEALTFNAYYGDYEIDLAFGDTVKTFSLACLEELADTVFTLKEEDAYLKAPGLIAARLLSKDTIELEFDKEINAETIKRGDFRFFSEHGIWFTKMELQEDDPSKLTAVLSSPVPSGTYVAISYFPGYLQGADGSIVKAFGPESIRNPLHDLIDIGDITLDVFSYMEESGPSDIQQFSLPEMELYEDLKLLATDGFEISFDSASGFVRELTIGLNDNLLPETRVYVRLESGLSAGDYTGSVMLSSWGSTGKTIDLVGLVELRPEISVSAQALDDFIYNYGMGPSQSESFTFTGRYLGEQVLILASENYEIAPSGSDEYGPELLVEVSKGKVVNYPVFVRLVSGLEIDLYTGGLSLSSLGIVCEEVQLSGEVVQANSIGDVLSDEPVVVSRQYFTITGQLVEEEQVRSGILIERMQLSDGSTVSRKILKMEKY